MIRRRIHGLSLGDLLGEATATVSQQPSRFILTALGTVLGVASLVATIGVAKTAGNQIEVRFDEASETEVVVEAVAPDAAEQTAGDWPIPWESQQLLEDLNGVVSAGTISSVDIEDTPITGVTLTAAAGPTRQLNVLAVSPGTLSAAQAEIVGTGLRSIHSRRASAVVVLGRGAAQNLNVNRVDNQPVIFIGEHPVRVIGIIEEAASQPRLLESVIVSDGFAQAQLGLERPESVVIRTAPAAAQLIGSQAALALAPAKPEELRVRVPADTALLRSRVGSDVNTLFLALGTISLAVGTIGIANVTLVSVRERTTELGLRRALGATGSDIGLLIVAESILTGLVAGVIGASLGTLVLVGVAAWRSWLPVLDIWVPLAAPVLGACVGLCAGAYPAMRAAVIEPIAALRSV